MCGYWVRHVCTQLGAIKSAVNNSMVSFRAAVLFSRDRLPYLAVFELYMLGHITGTRHPS